MEENGEFTDVHDEFGQRMAVMLAALERRPLRLTPRGRVVVWGAVIGLCVLFWVAVCTLLVWYA